MAQQTELEGFFQQISNPLRIAVQKEIFTSVIQNNRTIKLTISEIASDHNMSENLER